MTKNDAAVDGQWKTSFRQATTAVRSLALFAAVSFASLPAARTWAFGVEDLLFYATYDDSLTPVHAAGAAAPQKVVGDYPFMPGILGNAIVAGERGKTLAYAIQGNLDTQNGSISFWVKTLDWQAGDLKDHYLFYVPEKFFIRAASNSGGVHLEWQNFGGATYLYPQGPNRDQWKHLVYTWGDKEVVLYQNGKVAGTIGRDNRLYFPPNADLPKIVEGLFYICDPAKMEADAKNTSVMDELMVFNRPLSATEVKSLYRRVTASLPEPTLRIGLAKTAPTIDGVVDPNEWKNTAEFGDFVDVPFGNLSRRAIRANVAYDEKDLYVAVRDAAGDASRGDGVEVWLALDAEGASCCLSASADGAVTARRGGEKLAEGVWQAKTSSENGVRSFEIAIPWTALGAGDRKLGDSIRFNVVRRWSAKYGDAASWAGSAAIAAPENPSRFGRITLGGDKPVFVLNQTGNLNYAQLDLAGSVVGASGETPPKAEVRLQPSDFKEFYDPKTLPGTKSYTGTQINVDPSPASKGSVAEFHAATAWSDTDIDSLWLKVLDASGETIYQAQRPFVPEPPLTLAVQTFPSRDRLELHADVSNYREGPLDGLHADIELVAEDKTTKTARIDGFSSASEHCDVPLSSLPFGRIVVKGTLSKLGGAISEFTTAFNHVAPGPWCDNALGKDDVVLPPFTPVKVDGQSVIVWGRTYRWQNSLFPVQVSSGEDDLLAGPIELVAGDAPIGAPNAADVKILEKSDTHAIVECVGSVSGVTVTARHRIEYDGMCLTQLVLSPNGKTQLPKLSLAIPYLRAQSTLYSISPNPMAGAVRETVNPLSPPLQGGRDLPFRNTVWLGNEDRGMTWFTEDGKGWRFKDNNTPLGIHCTDATTMLTVRFAAVPFEIDQPVTMTFGLIATPVKPMNENWRFLRSGRDWQLRWFNIFTVSNNDIVHPFPSYKDYLVERHKEVPFHVVYQRPDWINTREPECDYFGEEWLATPRTITGSDAGDEAFGVQRHLQLCLGSKWQDFMLYYAVKAFDDLHMDGYYFDGGSPIVCANAEHGHGWVDDLGELRPTWTILAYREFSKRLQVELRKRGRPTLNVFHMSGYIEMPAASFFDLQWNGEQFSVTATPARDYNRLITPAYFRAVLFGQPFGIPQQWLVEFVEPPGQEPIGKKEIDTVLELAMLHGVGDNCLMGCLGSQANDDYMRKVLSWQDAFGVREKDCKFLPYWSNAKYVSLGSQEESVLCSLWQRPGKVLVILANTTPDARTIQVQLDLPSLGLKEPLMVRDLRSDRQVKVSSGRLETEVGPSNWKMLQVEPE